MNWNNGWHDSPGLWGWMLMALMMVVFWGGVAWVIVNVVRHGGSASAPAHASGPPTQRTGPEDILHERFARGELDVEEYHHRVDALRAKKLD